MMLNCIKILYECVDTKIYYNIFPSQVYITLHVIQLNMKSTLLKVKQPTPRTDGKIGAHPIRKIKKYVTTDTTVMPSSFYLPTNTISFPDSPSTRTYSPQRRPSSYKEISERQLYKGKKPLYIFSESSSTGYKTIVSWFKQEFQTLTNDSVKYSQDKGIRCKDLSKRKDEDSEYVISGTNDVESRRTVNPLRIYMDTEKNIRDSWSIILEGIFLECVRMFWLISRRNSIEDVCIDQCVSECIAKHPVRVEGFLVSETIDVCLEDPRTRHKESSVSTTLSYLTKERNATVDHLLVLNERGVLTMKRFISRYSRTSSVMTKEIFDSMNARLVVSNTGRFYVEPYIRIKTVPYIS